MAAPFDGRFKTLAEGYPDLLLRLLGILEHDAKSGCLDVLRELQIDPVQGIMFTASATTRTSGSYTSKRSPVGLPNALPGWRSTDSCCARSTNFPSPAT
jgi:hypothetical protein